jgi:glycerol uptake facilitator-like aquaporin
MTSTRIVAAYGEAALALQFGQKRFNADWKSAEHRFRRLLGEFIGTAGLTFVLSGGAAIMVLYGGIKVEPLIAAFVLSAISSLWLVVAIYFLGDISSHFNPAMTFAFTVRGDMGWVMCDAYVVVQLVAAAAGSFLARSFFGIEGNLAATIPQSGQALQAALFEAILTFGMVLMVLSMANGPKLSGQFIPLAVGAYIMAMGTLGGPYEGAAMNPARAFGPDLARGDLSTWWVYIVGPLVGSAIAVGVAGIFRGRRVIGEKLDEYPCVWRGGWRARR